MPLTVEALEMTVLLVKLGDELVITRIWLYDEKVEVDDVDTDVVVEIVVNGMEEPQSVIVYVFEG